MRQVYAQRALSSSSTVNLSSEQCRTCITFPAVFSGGWSHHSASLLQNGKRLLLKWGTYSTYTAVWYTCLIPSSCEAYAALMYTTSLVCLTSSALYHLLSHFQHCFARTFSYGSSFTSHRHFMVHYTPAILEDSLRR